MALTTITRTLVRVSLTDFASSIRIITAAQSRTKYKLVDLPETGHGRAFRRIVHFPEKYTTRPLEVTNLAGRDPVTGRVVVKGIGGGIKHKYHWVDWIRKGPKDGPPQIEKVLRIIKDGCRTADVALVAVGNDLKYILATENMKAGDMLKTSAHIPRIPVRANEGDAYPLGALPMGTQVHCVEKVPGLGGMFVHSAGTFASIVRRTPDGNNVVIKMPSKREFSLSQECMCTVGRLSNVAHSSTPIGSAQRNRELGNRPRSGLWKRKTGVHGRKLRKLPPVQTLDGTLKTKREVIKLTLLGFD